MTPRRPLALPRYRILTIILWSALIFFAQQSKPLDKEVNMFDNLPYLTGAGKPLDTDELKRYLAADVERVEHPIQWWQDRRTKYPRLSRMAIDYLTIPGAYAEHLRRC